MSDDLTTLEEMLNLINMILDNNPKPPKAIEISLDYMSDDVIFKLTDIGYKINIDLNGKKVKIHLK